MACQVRQDMGLGHLWLFDAGIEGFMIHVLSHDGGW